MPVSSTPWKTLNSSIAVPGLDRKKSYDPVAKDYCRFSGRLPVFQNHAVRKDTGCPTVRLTMAATENHDHPVDGPLQ